MNLSPRILLIGDCRHHHDPRGTKIIADVIAAAGIEVTATEDAASVADLAGGEFDCVVIYTQGDTFDASQEQALANFVRDGKGLVGVHSAAATNKTSDPYAKLIGSRFIRHGPVCEYTVHVSDPDHAIARGVKDFQITDELYVIEPHDQFQTFLTGSWEEKQLPLGYTKVEGKGRVVYLANGHDPRALSQKTFQELLVRGVRYACGDS